MQKNACVAFSDNSLFGTFTTAPNESEGKFVWSTYGEHAVRVEKCRSVLRELGIGPNSKIGLISNNRWEWAALASAAHSLSASIVPMYEAQMPKDWTYILNDSGCEAVFCSTSDIFDRVINMVLPEVPALDGRAVCFDAPAGEPHALATALERATATVITGDSESGNGIVDSPPTPDDLAGLIYTSGTTGKPKGVELTHDNFVSNVLAVRQSPTNAGVHPSEFIRSSDRSLAFLPWAHSYGQTCELWCAIAHGGSMGICRGVPYVLEDLATVKPTVLFAVPTLYKKVYDGVQNLIGSSSPAKQKLMRAALDMGAKKRLSKNNLGLVDSLKHKFLDALVTSKIRNRFGGRLRHGFVAGAACPSEIIDFMDDVGVPVCEGYGLTETSPIIAICCPYDGMRKSGSVGKPLDGVTVMIVDPKTGEEIKEPGREGEICCHGRNVMRGYYRNPDATAEVISTTPDGKSRLFHTGDLGTLDGNGFLSVTGRLKEQYKLENGKYITPTPIEEAVSMSRFVGQVVVCGANRPHNVALIVPDWTAIRSALSLSEDETEESLADSRDVRGLIDEEIRVACNRLKKYEVPKSWVFVAPFTGANGMLTPKMSVRRKVVMKHYGDAISEMYGDDPMFSGGAYDGGGGGGKDENEKMAA